MASKKDPDVLGYNYILLYTKMIEEKFAPLFAELEHKLAAKRQALALEVKREMGYFELVTTQKKLEAQLGEVNKQLAEFTMNQKRKMANGTTKYMSKIDFEVERRMEDASAEGIELACLKKRAIDSIRLSSATGEVKELFLKLSADLDAIGGKIKALPVPTVDSKLLEMDV